MDIVNRGATSVIAPKLLSIYRGAISKTVTNYGFNLLFWTGRRREIKEIKEQAKDHIWPKRMNRHFSELDRVPNCPSNIPVTVEINDPSRSPSCGLRRWNSIYIWRSRASSSICSTSHVVISIKRLDEAEGLGILKWGYSFCRTNLNETSRYI